MVRAMTRRTPSDPPPAPPGAPASDDHAPEAGWFGFRPVDPEGKAPLVRQVFDSVAQRYDLMNDLMSGGVHRLWKSTLIDMVAPRPGMVLLDVAGGTGDIALRFLDRAPGGTVHVVDINEQMIRVGRDRAIDRGVLGGLDGGGIDWTVGDAERLPVASRSCDVYTIAFGLRNVTRIDAAIAEAKRVLKPGGRFFVLEFSRIVVPLLREAYDRYSFTVLPRLGQLVAGDKDSYQYLVESIRRFPDQESLAARIRAAGFGRVRYRNLTGGIAAIHSGWRI
jgi:demethylmenaquinone methyltransferase / 2-methoxy-6-polyprenyl-1,4-benzoquinol methylase